MVLEIWNYCVCIYNSMSFLMAKMSRLTLINFAYFRNFGKFLP